MKDANRIWYLMGRRLSGAITPQESDELRQQLSRDPELWYAFEQLEAANKLDDDTNVFVDEIRSILERPADAPPLPPARKRRTLSRLAVAAVICLAVWAALYGLRSHPKSSDVAMTEIVAPKGSRTYITLADGTQVWLNAGSRLTYPKHFSLENREVFLEGEALFKVVHSDTFHFVVHTLHADIRDLGTTFNVQAYKDGAATEATLIEGEIEVSLRRDPGKPIRMAPLEKLVVRHGTEEAPVKPVLEKTVVVPYAGNDDIIETAWVSDKLIFRDKRFDEVAAMMERKYNVDITISDLSLRATEVTGAFHHESLEQALRFLQVITPFKYRLEHEKVYIYP
ncbi:FecR family protein [Chitinophaga lutea]